MRKNYGVPTTDATGARRRGINKGLLEAPYHNALYYALNKRGCEVVYNAPFNVLFEGHTVGE